jgi:hypothetical protein
MSPKEARFDLGIPGFVNFGISSEPKGQEKMAAWDLYVELSTRITTVELKENEGLIRESLSSIYSIFDTSREILKKYGPGIAGSSKSSKNILSRLKRSLVRKKTDTEHKSLGLITLAVLNHVLRPFLTKWHPLLLDHEDKKPEDCSTIEHERKWDRNEECRKELRELRIILDKYASLLTELANVEPVHELSRTIKPVN